MDFYSLEVKELEVLLEQQFALPAYRARQLFQWVYKKNVRDISLMTNIGKVSRDPLLNCFSFDLLKIKDVRLSEDGSRKYLFEVDGGDLVEAVMIKQPERMTLCVSSQVGCSMGCAFCRTATMGLKRNLTASEIVRQIVSVVDDAPQYGDMFQNIVFMGMGEPLNNLDNLTKALRIIRSNDGLSISGRRVTVSTCGLVPGIRKLGESGVEVNLAVSLNATSDEVRDRIMPVNKGYPLSELLKSLKEFPLKPRKRITFEYVLIPGINDSEEDLRRLPRLLKGIRSKINLIPYNPASNLGFNGPSRESLETWHDTLLKAGIETTIRWSKGADIMAACGQLASSSCSDSKRTTLQANS